MSCLSIVVDVCKRVGITVPNTATGSSDPQVIQLVALLNEEGKELAQRREWQALTQEATFTTVATEDQGAITTIAPGMKYIINDTIWNRDLRRPVFGPLGAQRWQQLKAMAMQGPWNQFRIVVNQLKMIPAPAAGQSCYFEYVTKNWCYATSGSTKAAFTEDEDETYLDEALLTLGLRWRWKAAKGLEYAEDFNSYERQVMDAMARDGGRDLLNYSDTRFDIYPGVVVSSGSWGL